MPRFAARPKGTLGMLFGLDGVEVGLIIVFLTLFAGIMTGFPVAFAIGGQHHRSVGGEVFDAFLKLKPCALEGVDDALLEHAARIRQGDLPGGYRRVELPDQPPPLGG